jgi:hypothetical protein
VIRNAEEHGAAGCGVLKAGHGVVGGEQEKNRQPDFWKERGVPVEREGKPNRSMAGHTDIFPKKTFFWYHLLTALAYKTL